MQDPSTPTTAPSLSKLSAATALEITKTNRRPLSPQQRGTLDTVVYDTHTKKFNRDVDLGAVRLNAVYKQKRSTRYDLARDDRWMEGKYTMEKHLQNTQYRRTDRII